MNNQSVVQGLISIEVQYDHVYMHLIESAPFNKGKSKIYAGVPGNLVAFACKLSFQRVNMKKKKIELDVDFIGGQGPLTKEEEQAISNFIKARKLRKSKAVLRKGKKRSSKKIIA